MAFAHVFRSYTPTGKFVSGAMAIRFVGNAAYVGNGCAYPTLNILKPYGQIK